MSWYEPLQVKKSIFNQGNVLKNGRFPARTSQCYVFHYPKVKLFETSAIFLKTAKIYFSMFTFLFFPVLRLKKVFPSQTIENYII